MLFISPWPWHCTPCSLASSPYPPLIARSDVCMHPRPLQERLQSLVLATCKHLPTIKNVTGAHENTSPCKAVAIRAWVTSCSSIFQVPDQGINVLDDGFPWTPRPNPSKVCSRRLHSKDSHQSHSLDHGIIVPDDGIL
jgi:hypothetical protein